MCGRHIRALLFLPEQGTAMTPEQRTELASLVSFPPNPYLPLDARLQPFLDLFNCAIDTERRACAHVVFDEMERWPISSPERAILARMCATLLMP
jgi:hypothetical protein